MQALEKRKLEKQVEGEIETEHPGCLGCQDTYYVGTIKGCRKDLPADLYRFLF
ncbi:hypothetical protein LEP1GSC165_1439 [Leptospira santarosai str. CBC523]|nr:hypothetical protein LEP1GSC165_1439 [Leptospira santarosai str. CBC523]